MNAYLVGIQKKCTKAVEKRFHGFHRGSAGKEAQKPAREGKPIAPRSNCNNMTPGGFENKTTGGGGGGGGNTLQSLHMKTGQLLAFGEF